MRSACPAVAVLSLLLQGILPAPAQAPASKASRSSTEVEQRVQSILGKMTLEEKIDLLGGVDFFDVRGVPRLGVPRMRTADGPLGVRGGADIAHGTAMAGGIALAATWNPALAEHVGKEIGRDARARGKHFLLGPGVNIYRAPMCSRNFEYFGEDPFLAARIAVGYIKGVQGQGVSATIKHYMGNNSEYDRHNTDSVIDERTMREIYLPAFEAAVREAHVGSIMDSYNLTNGQHMTQNGHLNTEVARKEWGFEGIMMSDWVATYDAVAAANGGLDLEMPSGEYLNRKNLLPALKEGKVTQATIDDKVRHILRTAVRFGWLDRDQTDLSIPNYNQQGRRVALQAAREGMVLLKNEGHLLPLNRKKIKSIALIGPDAYPAVPVGGGSAQVQPFAAVSFLEGLSNTLGTSVNVYYHRGLPTLGQLANATTFWTAARNGKPGLNVETFKNRDLSGKPASTRVEWHVNRAGGFPADFDPASLFSPQPSSTRWSGYYIPQSAGRHDIFVQGAGEGARHRLYLDDKLVIDSWQLSKALVEQASVSLTAEPHKIVLEQAQTARSFGEPRLRLGITRQGSLVDPVAKALAAKADVVVVAAGFDPETEAEGGDRTFRLPPGQDELIREMASANTHTVVVLTSGGSVDTRPWLEHVPALLQAWYPGQEGGTALAEVLLGAVNPSGRLPITWERRWQDNPVHDSYYPEPGTRRVVYKEGVFVGYRGYEHRGTRPLFPFGYGQSYTTFKYSDLAIKPLHGKARGTASGPLYQVSFEVKNTGSREGAEVAQVYVGDGHAKVARPAKELKGFVKVTLRPGQTRKMSLTLDRRALSYYDAQARRWHAEPGEFTVLVGRSSADIELRGKLTLPAEAEPKGK